MLMRQSGWAGVVTSSTMAVLYVALSAFARLYLGVHSIADVIGGLFLGICSIFVANGILSLLVLPSTELSVTSSHLDPSSGHLVCAGAAIAAYVLVLFFYPDKSYWISTYKDVLSITGMCSGGLLVVGYRISSASSLPFITERSSIRFDFIGIAIAFIFTLAGLACMDLSSKIIMKALEKKTGFSRGIFRLLRMTLLGVYAAWVAGQNGLCHLPNVDGASSWTVLRPALGLMSAVLPTNFPEPAEVLQPTNKRKNRFTGWKKK